MNTEPLKNLKLLIPEIFVTHGLLQGQIELNGSTQQEKRHTWISTSSLEVNPKKKYK
jgi:hypothetical protein